MRRYIAQKTEAGWVVDFGRLNEVRDKFLVAYEAVQTASMPFTIQAGRTKAESTVQKYLGHKSILTTQRYAHLAPKHLMAGINRLDPKKKRATSTRTSTEEIREIARAAKA